MASNVLVSLSLISPLTKNFLSSEIFLNEVDNKTDLPVGIGLNNSKLSSLVCIIAPTGSSRANPKHTPKNESKTKDMHPPCTFFCSA